MATTKRTVYYTEMTMNPRAQCETCTWNMGYSKATTAALCKAHVAETGHKVRRIKETIAVYYPTTD
jgi:hypothetical protein